MDTVCAPVGIGVCPSAHTASAGGGDAFCGSASRMSAPSPRPNAFLGIAEHLLSNMLIAFPPAAVCVIENNRLTTTRCLRSPHVPRNHRIKHLLPQNATQFPHPL